MHNHDSQKRHPEWIIDANNIIASQTNKKFYAKDSCGSEIVIEWEQINAKSPKLSEKIKSLSQLLIDSYTKIELQFAKEHPECIKTEMFLSSLEPLLSQGIENIDWNLAEQQIRETLTKFFVETDWTKFSNTNDIYLFATAKDIKTNALLGMIQFMITTEYEYGTVKIALYDGVMPLEPQRKINHLLISLIFKILPIAKRLFFHTRITNTESIDNHQILGFTKFSGTLPNWTDLEYKITQANQLQAIANTFQNTSPDKIKGACSGSVAKWTLLSNH